MTDAENRAQLDFLDAAEVLGGLLVAFGTVPFLPGPDQSPDVAQRLIERAKRGA